MSAETKTFYIYEERYRLDPDRAIVLEAFEIGWSGTKADLDASLAEWRKEQPRCVLVGEDGEIIE